MAEDLIASGAVEVADGYRLAQVNTTVWPLYQEASNVAYRYPAAEGDVFTLHQEHGEYEIQYGALDADGVEFWRPDGYQTPARPYSKTFTMPAGTAYVAVSWQRSAHSKAPTLVKVLDGGLINIRSNSTVNNLLKRTANSITDFAYFCVDYITTEPLVVGKTYTVSLYVEKVERSPLDGTKYGKPVIELYEGGGWWNVGAFVGDVPGQQHLTFTYKQPFPDHTDPNKISICNTSPYGGSDVTRSMSFHDVMLVEGDTPAAWAPAKGEMLAVRSGGDRP